MLYFVGCPSWQEAGRRLRLALDQLGRPAVRIDYVPVESGTAPGFHGSPTILVDGVDLFPGGVISDELTCRVYRGENGLGGVPDLADLVTALRGENPPTRRADPGRTAAGSGSAAGRSR